MCKIGPLIDEKIFMIFNHLKPNLHTTCRRIIVLNSTITQLYLYSHIQIITNIYINTYAQERIVTYPYSQVQNKLPIIIIMLG